MVENRLLLNSPSRDVGTGVHYRGTAGPSPGFSSREGQTSGGAKTQKGGHIFKIHYRMYVTTSGPNAKWVGTDFKWEGRAPRPPHRRWPRGTAPSDLGKGGQRGHRCPHIPAS